MFVCFVCLFVCVTQLRCHFLPDVAPVKSLTTYECKRDVGEEVKGHLVDQKRNGREPHSSSGRVLI
jgi:hypothetical protein